MQVAKEEMFEDGVEGLPTAWALAMQGDQRGEARRGKDRCDDGGNEAQVHYIIRVCTIFARAALVHQRRRHLWHMQTSAYQQFRQQM
jgi:hypothetical protein